MMWFTLEDPLCLTKLIPLMSVDGCSLKEMYLLCHVSGRRAVCNQLVTLKASQIDRLAHSKRTKELSVRRFYTGGVGTK